MQLLKLIYYPDPRLRRMAQPIVTFDAKLVEFAQAMLATMAAHDGLGLAATQVAVAERIFVMNITADQGGVGELVVINPRILKSEGEQAYEEGCLSFPGVTVKVKRAEVITLAYQTVEGVEQTVELRALAAVCAQHEIDHLNGKTFIDYLPAWRRQKVLQQFKHQGRT